MVEQEGAAPRKRIWQRKRTSEVSGQPTRKRKRLVDLLPGKRINEPPYDTPGKGTYRDSGLPLPTVFFRGPHRRTDGSVRGRSRRKTTDSGDMVMPFFLDRRNWTALDYERSAAIWSYVLAEVSRARREQRSTDQEIFARVRAKKEEKVQRRKRSEERKVAKAEKRMKRMRKERIESENTEKVLAAVEAGHDTVGKIAKATGLDSRAVGQTLRRSLRSLQDSGLHKISARRYVIGKKRKRLTAVSAPQAEESKVRKITRKPRRKTMRQQLTKRRRTT